MMVKAVSALIKAVELITRLASFDIKAQRTASTRSPCWMRVNAAFPDVVG